MEAIRKKVKCGSGRNLEDVWLVLSCQVYCGRCACLHRIFLRWMRDVPWPIKSCAGHWGLSLIKHINGGSLLRRASFRRNTRPRLQSQSSSPGGRAHAKPYVNEQQYCRLTDCSAGFSGFDDLLFASIWIPPLDKLKLQSHWVSHHCHR